MASSLKPVSISALDFHRQRCCLCLKTSLFMFGLDDIQSEEVNITSKIAAHCGVRETKIDTLKCACKTCIRKLNSLEDYKQKMLASLLTNYNAKQLRAAGVESEAHQEKGCCLCRTENPTMKFCLNGEDTLSKTTYQRILTLTGLPQDIVCREQSVCRGCQDQLEKFSVFRETMIHSIKSCGAIRGQVKKHYSIRKAVDKPQT